MLLLLVIGGLGLSNASTNSGSAKSHDPDEGKTTETPLPVSIVAAKEVTSYERIRRYTGTVTARRTSEVGFERAARLKKVLFDEGDFVKANQPIAQLDVQHLKKRQAELTARRAEAAALLDELVAGPRKQTIEAARAEYNSLVAQVKQQRRTHERMEKLVANDAAAEQQLDDTQFALESLVEQKNAANQRLNELEEGTRKEKITAQKAVVAQLDAQIADLTIDINESTLVAPFEGRISKRFVDEGVYVSIGEPIVRIVEHAVLEARIGLPVNTATRLDAASEVNVVINEQSWKATVKRGLPEVDLKTRTQLMIFDLESKASQSVVPGEIARVEMAEPVAVKGYWLPLASLSPSTRGLWSIFVVVDGQIERREVELLYTDSDRVLVRGTLEAGESVVTNGTQRIVPGQQVKISP